MSLIGFGLADWLGLAGWLWLGLAGWLWLGLAWAQWARSQWARGPARGLGPNGPVPNGPGARAGLAWLGWLAVVWFGLGPGPVGQGPGPLGPFGSTAPFGPNGPRPMGPFGPIAPFWARMGPNGYNWAEIVQEIIKKLALRGIPIDPQLAGI